ncbi:MAG: cupredoxin domain-containing protein [Marinibacterium sp.]
MKTRHLLPAALLLTIAQPVLADETADICAEAQDRYVEVFGESPEAAQDAEVVLMYKYHFCPAEITVKAGTTVRWVNVDKRTSHSVLLKDGSQPESDRVFPEETIEMTFLSPGPQNYLCGPHWETQNMVGMVTVEP